MTFLEVIDCGPGTTVQDFGRPGYRRYGVSVSGAMDRLASAAANALAGNKPAAAALEFALLGGRFRVEAGEALLACVGADLIVDGEAIASGQSVVAPAESTVTVAPARGGVYAYLAAGGGFAVAPMMESRSMHRRSGISGSGVHAGERLPLGRVEGQPRARRMTPLPEHADGPIRVMLGPQDEFFAPETVRCLLEASFAVDPRSDRMGYRLQGPSLEHRLGYNIVSDGVLPGSIQVPGDGGPIVLMRDCQTTGGYPKIATVISADLDRLAQRQPGSAVGFRLVAREEAVAAARELQARLARLGEDVSPLVVVPSTNALLGQNLISGAVDGYEDP